MKAIANAHRPALFSILVLLLVAAGFSMMMPAPAQGACCGWEITTTYWGDSAHTIWCGECYTDCSGYTYCTGVKTSYWTRSRVCCGPCLP